jgi:hypothetical protein
MLTLSMPSFSLERYSFVLEVIAVLTFKSSLQEAANNRHKMSRDGRTGFPPMVMSEKVYACKKIQFQSDISRP